MFPLASNTVAIVSVACTLTPLHDLVVLASQRTLSLLQNLIAFLALRLMQSGLHKQSLQAIWTSDKQQTV